MHLVIYSRRQKTLEVSFPPVLPQMNSLHLKCSCAPRALNHTQYPALKTYLPANPSWASFFDLLRRANDSSAICRLLIIILMILRTILGDDSPLDYRQLQPYKTHLCISFISFTVLRYILYIWVGFNSKWLVFITVRGWNIITSEGLKCGKSLLLSLQRLWDTVQMLWKSCLVLYSWISVPVEQINYLCSYALPSSLPLNITGPWWIHPIESKTMHGKVRKTTPAMRRDTEKNSGTLQTMGIETLIFFFFPK